MSGSNVAILNPSLRTKITFNFLNSDEHLLRELVWLPFLHASAIRRLCPEAVTGLIETHQTNAAMIDDAFAWQMSQHYHGPSGGLFGISVEFIAQVIALSFPFSVLPIAKGREAWCADLPPDIQITCNDVDHVVKIQACKKPHNEEFAGTDCIDDMSAEVDKFVSYTLAKAPQHSDRLLMEKTKSGFQYSHVDAVIAILLSGIDKDWSAERPDTIAE